MKLGTETGSLINHIYTHGILPADDIAIGTPATICHWTDRTAGTVVEVQHFKSGTKKGQPSKIVVQQDIAKVVKGDVGVGSAIYEYERNPEGAKYEFKRTKRGWRGTSGVGSVAIGTRDEYYDPSF